MQSRDSYNILIVEDEWASAQFLASVVEELGYTVIATVVSATEALEITKKHRIDLVFMDINIDGAVDGITCANLLNQQHTLPIIFTTAYKDTKTIQGASKTNIYGYLIKPFDENDIEASLSVAMQQAFTLKQTDQPEEEKLIINLGYDYIYNFENSTLHIKNIPIPLTHKELQVLEFLCLNINQNITYEMFQEHIWQDKIISNSNIRDTISRLRKKTPLLSISNKLGLGYCLKKI